MECLQVDVVECWLTQQPEEEATASAAGSVLDRYVCLCSAFDAARIVTLCCLARSMCACWLQLGLELVFRFKEDRNLMDLAGKGTSYSAGYREAPPEED